jgi:hypothetical protein
VAEDHGATASGAALAPKLRDREALPEPPARHDERSRAKDK